ncbi:MAG: hypothetical protein NVSMB53_07800 [Gemmatimonadaceae bacterium]
MTRRSTESSRYLASVLGILFVGACTAPASSSFGSSTNVQTDQARQDQILIGRAMVVSHDCGGCHGGGSNPAARGWLAGIRDSSLEFQIGPFRTRPKNLTPDVTTGIGSFTERQIFNSLRFGLRPEETADVEIASTVPGQGNFPLHPHFLAPPMPWPAWRNMSDQQLYAIAAYLKNGVKPVKNKVRDSDGPPDFWASEYTVEKIGPYPVLPYPTANERR